MNLTSMVLEKKKRGRPRKWLQHPALAEILGISKEDNLVKKCEVPSLDFTWDQYDINSIFARAPKDQIIIGRDFDSITTAIFLQRAFNSEVVGLYDSTSLRILSDKSITDALFVDMETFRKNIFSIGNHLTCIHDDCFDQSFLQSCISCANPNLAKHVSKENYNNKYPFGTNLFCLSLMERSGVNILNLGIQQDVIRAAIAFSDGSLNSIYRYYDNARQWTDTFFKDTPMTYELVNSLFFTNAFEKDSIDKLFKKTSVSKFKYAEDLKPYVEHIHECFGIPFDSNKWFFDRGVSLYSFTVGQRGTTKRESLSLYKRGSKMVTCNIAKSNTLFYTIDDGGVFG